MNPVPPRYGKVKYLACRYTSASAPGVKIMNHYIRVNIGFGTGPDHVVEETATHRESASIICVGVSVVVVIAERLRRLCLHDQWCSARRLRNNKCTKTIVNIC